MKGEAYEQCEQLARLTRGQEFSRDEIELLAYGFGYFVQEFNHADDDPVHDLMDKLYRLRDAE